MMIQINNLIKNYDGGLVRALQGVSLEARRGEIVSITGPSGSGKSTLLNMIGAIDAPTSGEIIIDGKSIERHKPLSLYRARYIGFVFQFHHLLPHLSLQENVEIPMFAFKNNKRKRREKARSLLEQMQLGHRLNFSPTKVSGGERQRAAIARALANDPKIILADEPTGAVDTETGTRILQFLIDHCRDNGVTMLIATHNQDIVAMTERCLRMKNGAMED